MSKGNYQATLFHPDGESVTDFRESKTKEEVCQGLQNMGSRWVFYPIEFVTTDKTVVMAPDGLEFLEGKRIKTVKKVLADRWAENADEVCRLLNMGAPLSHVYGMG